MKKIKGFNAFFKSVAQKNFLFSKKPELAKEFAEHTPKSTYKDMPNHVAKDKNHLKDYTKKHRKKNG